MIDAIYISGVINESHLVYVASYISKLRGEGAIDYNTNIYFESNPRFLSNKTISPDVIRHWLGEVVFMKTGRILKSFRRMNIIHLFIGSVGIKPMMKMRMGNPCSKIKNIIIDEGIGSESNINAIKNVFIRERKVSHCMAYIHALMYVFIKRGLLVSDIWRLFDGTSPNVNIIEFIKKNRLPQYDFKEKHILFLTQPWVKLGVITIKDYELFLHEIINELRRYNTHLVIKPHPSEDFIFYHKFNVDVVESLHPIELCIDPLHCKGVFGFNSTSLILLNAIYNIPTFRLEYLDLDEVICISPRQESLFKKYSSAKLKISEICNELHLREF